MENRHPHTSYQHILKYTGLFGGMQGLNILIGIVKNKFVALILGTAGMGLVSLFNSATALINTATGLGLPVSSVKTLSEVYESGDQHLIREKIRTIRSLALFTAIFGVIVCVLLSTLFDFMTFSWGNHKLHYALLAPIVGMLSIIGGETAILKAVRQLKGLALVSLINVLVATVISIPIYYYFEQSGIIPALTLMTLAQLLITVRLSYRIYPLEIILNHSIFTQGSEMLRLGVAFMLSGMFTSGADFLVRSYLSKYADLDTAGLYNAGFMITMTYAGMVFTAMETDFFPRLSAVNKDVAASNLTVNRQIEVTFLLIAPMLTTFMIFMPLMVPLLYSGEFQPVIPMARVILLVLYLRALKLPVAYLTLAKADSWAFLALEAYSDVLMVVSIIVGYHLWGLEGTGWGLFITGAVDLVVIYLFAHFRYQYTVSSQVLRYVVYQMPVAILAFLSTRLLSGACFWMTGVLLSVVSLVISLSILRKKTSLWSKLTAKIKK